MATHDYVLANASGAAFRADLNNALAAIVSNNSSTTEPATTYAYMWWADTTSGQLKQRNAANDGWIVVQELDGTSFMQDGTVSDPGLAFVDDLDTGFFRPAANQLAIATNGVERIEFGTSEVVVNDGGADVDFRVEGDTEANLFLVDAGNDSVSIGGDVTIPDKIIHAGDTDTTIRFSDADTVAIETGGVENVEFGTAEVVFNDGGADVDFRVEGDTEENLLLVDAGNDLVRIGGGYNILKGFNRRPPLHRGPLFYKTAALTISIVADSALNGFFYDTATAVTMPGSFTDNTDYAIWQHPTTGALVADASFTSAPAGATGGSIVGGFHHIPSGRPTAVNSGSPTAAAEILEYSIWDLTWRPSCPDPRGMTCVDERFWCDLYFCGSTSYAGSDFTAVPSSKIGLTIADENAPPLIPAFYGGDGSTNYADSSTLEKGCWYDFCEVASSFGKRLLTMSEFQVAAFGAPEAGSRGTDPGTVIWERASKWGLAQATGTLYSWGADLLFRDVNSQTFGWETGVTRGRGNVFQQGNDDSLVAVRLGGYWLNGSNSGSRASFWSDQPWLASFFISARFAAEHLVTC